MTINKSDRNYRGKCLGWPVTSYGAGLLLLYNNSLNQKTHDFSMGLLAQ